jgi:predicted RNA binding protein YcfA (HicA-like mRNA interferase family)
VSPKLPSLSSRQIIAALRRAGFEDAPVRGKGSHHALVRRDPSGRKRLAIIPERHDVPSGTINDILKQAGLTAAELAELL